VKAEKSYWERSSCLRRRCIHDAASGDAGGVGPGVLFRTKASKPDNQRTRACPADRTRSSRRASETAIRTRCASWSRRRRGNWRQRLVRSPNRPKVINLMDALKRSLAQDAEPEPKKAAEGRPTRTKAVPDQCQRALRLSVSGRRGKKDEPVEKPTASTAPKRRKKA